MKRNLAAVSPIPPLHEYYLGRLAAGTATPNDIYILNRRQKPIVLRGTAQRLAVNFNNTALTGGNLNVDFRVD